MPRGHYIRRKVERGPGAPKALRAALVQAMLDGDMAKYETAARALREWLKERNGNSKSPPN